MLLIVFYLKERINPNNYSIWFDLILLVTHQVSFFQNWTVFARIQFLYSILLPNKKQDQQLESLFVIVLCTDKGRINSWSCFCVVWDQILDPKLAPQTHQNLSQSGIRKTIKKIAVNSSIANFVLLFLPTKKCLVA